MPELPDTLPSIVNWRMTCCTESLRSGGSKHHRKCCKPVERTTLVSLPRNALVSISSSGVTNAPIVKHYIPDGADAWRIHPESEWLPMAKFPEQWKLFLERK